MCVSHRAVVMLTGWDCHPGQIRLENNPSWIKLLGLLGFSVFFPLVKLPLSEKKSKTSFYRMQVKQLCHESQHNLEIISFHTEKMFVSRDPSPLNQLKGPQGVNRSCRIYGTTTVPLVGSWKRQPTPSRWASDCNICAMVKSRVFLGWSSPL